LDLLLSPYPEISRDSFRFTTGDDGSDWDDYRKLYAAGGSAFLEGSHARAEITATRLDQMILFDRKVRGLRHERAPEQAAANGFTHFVLNLNLRGVAEVDLGEGFKSLAEGEAVLLDVGMPMRLRMIDVHLLTASIARNLVAGAAGELAHGLRIRPERTAALRSLLGDKQGDGTADLVRAGPRLLVPMLAMLAPRGRRGVIEDRLQRKRIQRAVIRNYIKTKLASRDLGPAQIASACAISRATLYRLTEPDGGVAGLVRKVRLAQLERLLANGIDERLAELAQRLGFANESHMSRQFRAATGVSPGRYRIASSGDTAAKAARRRWTAWMAELN
jgi:AraC-like DNA-binding protein